MNRWCVLGILAVSAWAIDVPNGLFLQGHGDKPEVWRLEEGTGAWQREGVPHVFVRGDGKNMGYWRSATLPLEPGKLYRIDFRAKSTDASGGTAVTGPVFCNMDIGVPPTEWRGYRGVFMVPHNLGRDSAWLRFGQWHVAGEVAFADVFLTEVQAVHSHRGGLVLGDGEKVVGNSYVFQAPLGGDGHNSARPLQRAACTFNSNRWTFGADSEVVYAHQVGDRTQLSGSVEVTVGYYSGGQLLVEASADGKPWETVGTLGDKGTVQSELPKSLFPAKQVHIRLRAQTKGKVGAAQSDPGSFQVHGFAYRATLREPLDATMVGRTRYVAVESTHPDLRVAFRDLGAGIPGGDNRVVAEVTSTQPVAARCTVSFRRPGSDPIVGGEQALQLQTGANQVTVPYDVPGAGAWELLFSIKAGAEFQAWSDVYVPEFYASHYGALVPGSSRQVALWGASSGWKIPRTRPAPTTKAPALEVSMARNEAEAVQLVVRPEQPLSGLTVRPTGLRMAGGAEMPASVVEILRVAYVNVERPTDRTGVAAPWPDPLPPLATPLDVAAGQNQPLWVRVKAPAEAAPGVYEGTLELAAEGWTASVPLRVRVFAFSLPKRMTCQTAFGFSPSNVFRYQKLADQQQRREVIGKYLRNFSEHHISPYNPAPLDPLVVRWPKLGNWQGGIRDAADKVSGKSSLLLDDTSETANVSAHHGDRIAIPEKGLRVHFRYRTLSPGHQFLVTLNHDDAGGQWMSGRNNDMAFTGDGSWQTADRVISRFPEGAQSVRLTLWATLYEEDGHRTGGVRFDDFELVDLDSGKAVVKDGFEPVSLDSLRPTFDWTAWDSAITQAIDEYGFNTFRMGLQGMGGGTFHARHDPSLLGYAEGTEEYRTAFARYVGAIESHLREKGWLEEAFVYWFDEPDRKDYEFVMNGFRKLKTYAPGLRRMLTEQIEDELIGGPNLWCPVSSAYQDDLGPERRAAGDRFWWYVCTGPKAPYCTLFIDHPGTELRVWLWQTWKREIDGILVWETNYWTSGAAYPDAPQNPYADPMGWVSGYSTPKGTKRAWGNGDGRFIYPPLAAADGQPPAPVLDGPVDSIRWEMLRDGIEDYEYFAILKRLLAEKGDRLTDRQRESYTALLTVPVMVTTTRTDFTTDPAFIERHRHTLALAIEQLAD